MVSDNDTGRTVKTTDTVFGIVESLKESDGKTISELASELGMAKSTIHDHVSTLAAKEYLVKSDDRYRIGLKFLELGVLAKTHVDIATVAQPTLDAIADETGEAVGLFVEEHGRRVYLSKAIGDQAIETHGKLGKRTYLHTSAAGKAILAFLPRERVEDILDRHGMPALTHSTITNREGLFEELEEIRAQNISINKHESVEGLHAMASAIVYDETVYGAVGVAGPANRIKGDYFEETLPDILLSATNEIELRLKSQAEL